MSVFQYPGVRMILFILTLIIFAYTLKTKYENGKAEWVHGENSKQAMAKTQVSK